VNLNPHNPQDDKEPGRKGPPLAIIAGLIAVVALGAITVTLAMSGGSGNNDPASESKASQTESSSANAGPDVAPTIEATAVPATPTPEPPPPPTPTPEPPAPAAAAPSTVESLTSVGSGDRLVISRFGVSAPITVKTVGKDGQMPNPAGEDDVAYYNFSNWPGYGGAPGKGNAVFAGHVDSGFAPCKYGTVPPPCTAVLWDLSKISIGDVIEIRLGGTTYRYSVVSSRSVPEASDWGPIVAATAKPTVTVITCGGDFNAATHSYDHRQVVKAELM
jgi:hypothetical protein